MPTARKLNGFDKVYLDKTYPEIIVTKEMRNYWKLLKKHFKMLNY